MATSAAPAITAPGPYAVRIQVPTDIGEVGLKTRSMLRNRSGRPRSATSASRLTVMAPVAPIRAPRARAGRPDRSAPAPSNDEPPAMPPMNRYSGMAASQGAALTTGRP